MRVFAWCLWLTAFIVRPLFAEEPPNIVYIMADELGYYELSCMGNPNIQTPRHRPDGPRGHALHAGAGRLVGVCPDALLPDDRQAQRPHLGALERRRHAAAGRRGDGRLDAEAGRLRDRRVRQVGLRRPRLDRRAGEARLRRVPRLLRPGPRPQLLPALHRPQQRGSAAGRTTTAAATARPTRTT